MSVKRGALIVLEGIDRSGKSTQCKKLEQTLQKEGKKVHLMKLPDRSTKIGQVLDGFLNNEFELEDLHAVHLLFAANQWEAVPKIKELIEKGTNVVLDRYVYSGVAYRAAEGLPMDWCKTAQSGFPRPDLVLFLNISTEDAANRPGFGGERYEIPEFQQEVSTNYELLQEEDNWRYVEAGRSIEEVHNDIKGLTLTAMEACADTPLRELWNN